MTTTRRARRWTLLAALAGLAVLMAAGTQWRMIRAWVVLKTQFERVRVSADADPQYRHVDTGIVFVVRRSQP